MQLIPLLETLRLENIDDKVYFSDKYGDYISNSKLGLINPDQGGSWEKYKAGFAGNKIYSDSLKFGSAIHESQLQPESFFIVDTVNRPTAKVGFISDLLYTTKERELTTELISKAALEVDYYKGILSKNQVDKVKETLIPYFKQRREFEATLDTDKTPIYLDATTRERYYACANALNANNKIQSLLKPKGVLSDPLSYNEQTILLDVEVRIENQEPFILKLKSKLDNFTIDTENNVITVNDIKTTGKRVNLFHEAIDTYHYCRELGMYSWLLGLCAQKFYGLNNPVVKGNFLVVSTIPQYYTKVVPMTKSMFLKGFKEFKTLLELVANYTHNDRCEQLEV